MSRIPCPQNCQLLRLCLLPRRSFLSLRYQSTKSYESSFCTVGKNFPYPLPTFWYKYDSKYACMSLNWLQSWPECPQDRYSTSQAVSLESYLWSTSDCSRQSCVVCGESTSGTHFFFALCSLCSLLRLSLLSRLSQTDYVLNMRAHLQFSYLNWSW